MRRESGKRRIERKKRKRNEEKEEKRDKGGKGKVKNFKIVSRNSLLKTT